MRGYWYFLLYPQHEITGRLILGKNWNQGNHAVPIRQVVVNPSIDVPDQSLEYGRSVKPMVVLFMTFS